jgi:uncharacterized OsmC-like protein
MNWESFCRNADRLFFRRLIIQRDQQGGCSMSTSTMSTIINGVNVDRMSGTVQAVQQNPRLATFQFRAANRWITGGHNRSAIQSFYGAGQEDTVRTKPFVLDADEPPVLLGDDHGANPVEYVLHALAACLTTSLVYHAAARGIRIESVESQLEGDLDLRGFLGLSETVRRGYQQIRVRFTIKTDASAEQLQELTQLSPVHDIVSNPVPVEISIATQPTA